MSTSPQTTVHTAGLAAHSRLYQRLHRRYAEVWTLLAPGLPDRAAMAACCDALQARGQDLAGALRVLRQLVVERLMVLDCERQAPLEDICTALTTLAELALDRACLQVREQLDAQHGAPLDAAGEVAQLWVVGMGKLGARELNVSSDIDLICIYESDGETAGLADGRGRISNHEYFVQAVRRISALIGEQTQDGFVFRVDLALRPHGNSGPLAMSLAALQDYLRLQGREWERFAWLKSRVVAPTACIASPNVQALRQVVLPFVFRRYLDYAVFDALRVLHRQIRQEAQRRCAGHPERANDVKLSRGGIREIEFTVQLVQVVRGGQFPELRCRPTLEALQRLARAGLMPQESSEALAQAYVFLRQVEHRIQYLDDQQTHVLPTQDHDLGWIAHTMGMGSCEFLRELDAHRERVAHEFDALLGGPEKKTCSGPGCRQREEPPADWNAVIEAQPATVGRRMQDWHQQPRVRQLSDKSTERLMRILRQAGQWLTEGGATEEGALRLLDWLEQLLRRESYLALLVERPLVLRRLLTLLGAARWPARYLQQHPGVIDELASEALFVERFDASAFTRELQERRASLRSTGEDDEETLLNLLRRAHHAEVFRTLARDVDRRLTVEEVADDLSLLADSVLAVTTQWCWELFKGRHRERPQLSIIGYGKLGGKELGYGSDLDLVFAYDDTDDKAAEIYPAFVRKLLSWLTVKTGEGDLFEIDTQLRPNGNSGLLVTSFDAYAAYQQQRGSNTAWTWEHQAMTRARCVLGSPVLRERFDAIREAVITAPRDLVQLASEIIAMRERLHGAHRGHPALFDVKHSRGGMVDVEFAVQYLVLAHSREHPELRENKGNIGLLERAEQAGLLPAGVGHAAANAYRQLRQMQHRARLNEEATRVAPDLLAMERHTVLALWDATFAAVQHQPL
ncbi:bifunctional [glutamate--ammonia ligase]-adenylyl-L-tyrosine phosphorylase/[glutamate--ammonia-ligase] adenylyltransferase [Comamonas sp. NLF-1-9]|uniref:bifunctional [glutamate--ammonia ligase]-adenylyl-L-tyrosine phosphorylase/[glutamate--ammonia-ligase] adenylyltransferase n=1 Tax=Comamonas sp. NLF-1-9 TaxID=2853163 RepID=UPI001C43A581|nr:bifunctional [glutamate--ammonia ligase]-adenylyl-L-tyrosine phosphorylase/[glutamate--ammonia-ligase] adenylyltransferase [Comamonas sp. NLF-1-9]QXL84054.1 bifunctional [glutamate--ammonia ligase]-adenylyl-L-tyrosine phosphorylase/[glutamate--ammonia-ligase] adenylyltransferase [Comamonas sp. NLF-1-9]